jgi:hypothetical protein
LEAPASRPTTNRLVDTGGNANVEKGKKEDRGGGRRCYVGRIARERVSPATGIDALYLKHGIDEPFCKMEAVPHLKWKRSQIEARSFQACA